MKWLFAWGIVLISLVLSAPTLGYWDTLVAGDNYNITIGEWIQAFEWNPNQTYQSGETVLYNGITYLSLKNNNNKTPDANNAKNWWQPQ